MAHSARAKSDQIISGGLDPPKTWQPGPTTTIAGLGNIMLPRWVLARFLVDGSSGIRFLGFGFVFVFDRKDLGGLGLLVCGCCGRCFSGLVIHPRLDL